MSSMDGLLERLDIESMNGLSQVVVYDERSTSELYKDVSSDISIPGLENGGSSKPFIRKHFEQNPVDSDTEECCQSWTYYENEFVALQIPLDDFQGILVIFEPDAEVPLQRLLTAVSEWQKERRATIERLHDDIVGLVSLPAVEASASLSLVSGFCISCTMCVAGGTWCLPL